MNNDRTPNATPFGNDWTVNITDIEYLPELLFTAAGKVFHHKENKWEILMYKELYFSNHWHPNHDMIKDTVSKKDSETIGCYNSRLSVQLTLRT